MLSYKTIVSIHFPDLMGPNLERFLEKQKTQFIMIKILIYKCVQTTLVSPPQGELPTAPAGPGGDDRVQSGEA